MVFLMEKSLILILFMYIAGASLIGAQFIWADVFHVTMTNFQGVPLKDNLLHDINMGSINGVGGAVLNNTSTTAANAAIFTAQVAWDLILLMSGTYIFDFIFQMGVPAIFVTIFIIGYLFLLVRTIMGYVRGI